ncbi:MAG: tRNA pseudouridine(38-40) synthase TruA [Pseudomonadales bacterium]
MPRIALIVSYNGRAFHGWQVQDGQTRTVQGCLEEALASIAHQPITAHCAGRTDAGVHATHQIAHFDTDADRPNKAWVMGANSRLPHDIAVSWAGQVPDDFDARHSATARRYLYVIYNHQIRSALYPKEMTQEHRQLNEQAMHQAAQSLLGEQDFTSFRAANCQSQSPMRNVHKVEVRRQGHLVLIDIEANAFLHHMVRNIAGALLEVGANQHPPTWIAQLLQAKDRTAAAKTAPPDGLYLINVTYPTNPLPPGPDLPHLLAN